MAWNAGIFLWRRDAILAAFGADAPDILATIREGIASADLAGAYATIARGGTYVAPTTIRKV